MQNPFEVLENQLSDIKNVMYRMMNAQTEHKPGVDLDKYISLQKVAEMYGVSSQALCAHKHEIDYIKRFGQIFFLKASLAEYMENGRPVGKVKKVMRTRRKS